MIHMKRFLCTVFSVLAVNGWLLAESAHAWGADGHRVTGAIADSLLTPQARVRLNQILPAVSLADESTWLDEERGALRYQEPGSSKWHYDNTPVCGQGLPSPCPRGDCANNRLSQYRKVLGDPAASREGRAFALRVVVHLVGDIHQPLHEANNGDAGGNDVQVSDGRRSRGNLHHEWDSALVKDLMRGSSPERYAADLLHRYRDHVPELQRGEVADWASEAHEYAVKVAYGQLPGFACTGPVREAVLPQAYLQAAYPVVEHQLVAAGVRLAAILNHDLSGGQGH